MATSSDNDPFKEILAKKRQIDAEKAKSYKPSQDVLDFVQKIGPKEEAKPEQSTFDKAIEAVKDMGASALDEATYGHAADILPYVMPVSDTEKAKKELQDRFKQAEERSPIASTVGKLGGFAFSPITKVLGGTIGAESKLAAMLKDAGSMGKSPALRALAKTLGLGAQAAEGSAMVAAHEGEHTPVEIAGGGAFNALFNKLPNTVKGALIGGTVADAAGDKYLPNAGKGPAIAGAVTGALTGKGGSMLLNAVNARRDPAMLKKPLEFLEENYEKLGKEVPKELRGPNRAYAVPDWNLQSEKVRGIKGELEDLKVKELSDVPEKSKKAYETASKYLGDTKYELLGDIMGDPEKSDKLLTALKAINESNGVDENPSVTLLNIINHRKLLRDDMGYDPMKESVSDIIIGKIRQTPIRHIKAFNNVFSESRKLKDLNPDAIPNDILDMYGKTLQAEQDVRTGRLNKWLREADKAGTDTPDYARLFDPDHPHKLLTNDQAKKMTEEGRVVVLSPKQLKEREKAQQGVKDKFRDELDSFSQFIKSNGGKVRGENDGSDLLNALFSNTQNEGGNNLPALTNPNEQRINELMQRLYDMREGRRQLSLDRSKPSMVPYFIKDFVDRMSPLKMGEAGKMYDLLPINKLEKMDKNLRHYARMYGKGEMIENMPPEMRPQIIRLKELANRDDAIGNFSKVMLEQAESGNIDDFIKGMYMANQNNELRKFLQ